MSLVDTNVFSEARRGSQEATHWFQSTRRDDIRISVVTIGEIARGLEVLSRKQEARATTIANWLAGLRRDYSEQILPVSDLIAIEWGRLTAVRTRDQADAWIAATALVHDPTVVTRNTVDFADTGTRIVDPWRL